MFAAFAGVLMLLSYPEVALGLKSFVLRDYGIFGYPLAAHHKAAFWSGEIPLWNPYNCNGLPFLAQWNTMVLYPGSLIYLLLPLPWSLGLFMLFHQWLGALGMRQLAMRWTGHEAGSCLAGILFAFSGLMLNSLMWPNNIAALGLMPWVVLLISKAVDREKNRALKTQRILFAGLVAAAQFLAGAPEIIGFTWLLAFIGSLWNAPKYYLGRALTCAGIIGMALMLGAAQLLPFIDLLQNSQRNSAFASAEWSMPLWGWANFFVPLFRSYASPQGPFFQLDQEWTSSYYCGVVALCLAPFWFRLTRRQLIWPAILLFSLWMSFGPAAYLFAWAKQLFPPLGMVRFPIKFVVIVTFVSALLAAFALARFQAMDKTSARKSLMLGAAIVGIAICAVIIWARINPVEHTKPHDAFANGLLRLVALAGAAYLIWRLTDNESQAKWALPGIVALAALDLVTHAPRQNTTAPVNYFARDLARRGPLEMLTLKEGRAFQTRFGHDAFYFNMKPDAGLDYAGRRMGLYGNCNLLDAIATPDGFFSLYLPAQRTVWEKLFFAPLDNPPRKLADFLAIKAYTAPTNPTDWAQRSGAELPVLTAGQRPIAMYADEALQQMLQPDFDPRAVVYIDRSEDFESEARPVATSVTNVVIDTHRIAATVQADNDTVVVISQAWYPAWQATVDGIPARILKANYAFQAVRVPRGTHTVELRYVDRQFQIGAIISVITLTAVFAGILWCALSLRRTGAAQ